MLELLHCDHEVYRKFIHITSSIIAILLWIEGREILLPYIISAAIIFPSLDYLRRHFLILQKLYYKIFSIVTRPHENNKLSGASWVFIGSAVTIVLFNEKVAIISLLTMSLSDSAAAIIGIGYGRTKLFNKSLEGSIAFIITTTLIVFSLSPTLFIVNIFTVFAATLIELFSTPLLNDNLLIPLATGTVLTFGGVI